MKLLRHMATAIGLAALLAPTPADAQRMADDDRTALPDIGLAVSLGGGVMNFTQQAVRDDTGVGGHWDLNIIVGTRRIVGFEMGYVGTAQAINSVGLDGDAVLMSHGIQAALRVNFPLPIVQPYVFGGAGWRRYDIESDTNTSDVNDIDNVFETPVGGGLAAMIGPVIMEGRFTFRPTFEDELFPGGEDAKLHNWSVTGSAGLHF